MIYQTIMEDILHYAWKFQLFENRLKTTDGQDIEIIDVGLSNTNAGPDFFNSKIKVGGNLWAGTIEIHSTSDEWEKHNHHKNKDYNSVILHIVEKANRKIYNQLGNPVPQCEIVCPRSIKENYEFLVHSNIDLPCSNFFKDISPLHLTSWLNNLLFERLERKSNRILELLEIFKGSWEDTFYILLCRNFGFGLNSDAFERLALSLPLKYIQKQNNNIAQVEALLFGQAGLLSDNEVEDKYFQFLQQEYNFLRLKYTLMPIDAFLFKRMRVRPSASPIIRIAQLAALLNQRESLFSKILECKEIGKLRLMLHVNAAEYWQTHYSFGAVSEVKSKYLGDGSLDIILINTVVPILFTYGKSIGNEALCERAISFLENIKPENNSITRTFSQAHMLLGSAADSQAVIQLKREYCERKKCLYCRIGHQLLKKKN